MTPFVILTALVVGMLLTAVGLTLWDGLQEVPGLPRAVQVIGRLAEMALLVAVALGWKREASLTDPALYFALMAAIALSSKLHRRRSFWSRTMSLLLALMLTGIALFWASTSAETKTGGLLTTPIGPVMAVCGGLGARALSEAIGGIEDQALHTKWALPATYTLLTLLAGSTALVNLWQRGTVLWEGTAGGSRLAAAWLAWSAAWLSPRQPPWLRVSLIVVAELLIGVLVAGY